MFSFRSAVCSAVLFLFVFQSALAQDTNEFEPRGDGTIQDYVHIDISDESMAQSLGFYTKGTLINAFEVPAQGTGILKIFRSRQRGYTTDELGAVVINLGRLLMQSYPRSERVQMADFSGRSGGYISGHGSHQNGLDVDLIYLRVNRREMPVNSIGGMDEDFVKAGKLTSNFDVERNWFMFRNLTESGVLSRMFVDQVIKDTYCKLYQKQAETNALTRETLRRLRPWANHANHVHVRVKCPALSPKCTPQAEPAQGTGC